MRGQRWRDTFVLQMALFDAIKRALLSPASICFLRPLFFQRGILVEVNHNADLKHRICGLQILVVAEAENLAAD